MRMIVIVDENNICNEVVVCDDGSFTGVPHITVIDQVDELVYDNLLGRGDQTVSVIMLSPQLFEEKLNELRPRCDTCDGDGWSVSEKRDEEPKRVIVRCKKCNRYTNDLDAWLAADPRKAPDATDGTEDE